MANLASAQPKKKSMKESERTGTDQQMTAKTPLASIDALNAKGQAELDFETKSQKDNLIKETNDIAMR